MDLERNRIWCLGWERCTIQERMDAGAPPPEAVRDVRACRGNIREREVRADAPWLRGAKKGLTVRNTV